MTNNKLKVLLIIEQCNPEWSSVPLEGYNYFREIQKLVNATLVTHERNREAIERSIDHNNVFYISESNFIKNYYKVASSIGSPGGKTNWPLLNTLTYPIYAEFNQKVYNKFKTAILKGEFDIVHGITPMMPRYPFKIVNACQQTPFILGPVNGGVPFPEGFQETARKENANLNFLRAVGRYLIPGYVETYKKTHKVLSGSTYTLNLLKELFKIPDKRISLFYENGIDSKFLTTTKKVRNNEQINLIFVGRLVPYKCADIVIEAISKLEENVKKRVKFTIVGDGSERANLETMVKTLNLGDIVKFTGWVRQEETLEYYSKADIFCFPSIREFGGAVVIEAMACGLPCIVANNGGIGEYVTEETGFKIEPISREYLTQELTKKIQILVENEKLWEDMSVKSVERAKEFTWEEKAKNIVSIYESMASQTS
ncbi:MAG: glycosyltransferase family 4 protein [Microcoleaceae cyanobacterium]